MDLTKKNIYQQFCKKNNLPFYIQDWYLDTVCKDGAWNFVYVEEDEQIVGVHPYYIKTKFGFTYITMPILVKYMGPFIIDEKDNLADQHRIYGKLIEQLPRVHSYWQNCQPRVTNWLPYYWAGFQQTTRYTYRLNIEDPTTVYQNFSDKTHYKLRKAKKLLTVVDDLPASQFHDIHKMSFDRQGLEMPFSLNIFLSLHKELQKRDASKMLFAVDEGQNIHAVLYIVLDNEIAYMQFLGSNPAFTKSEAVNHLYWYAIQHLSDQHQIKQIDFQGGMMKNIENIFRRLRARQVAYFSITKDDSRLFRILQWLKGSK